MQLVAAALHVPALLLGATVGLGSVVVHRFGVLEIPLGLLLGLATTFVVAWALRQYGVRRLTCSYAAGWLVVFGFVLAGRPEGDYAVAGDLPGYLMIAAAFVLVVIGVLSLGPRGSAPVGGPT
jgi:hypothetical protein